MTLFFRVVGIIGIVASLFIDIVVLIDQGSWVLKTDVYYIYVALFIASLALFAATFTPKQTQIELEQQKTDLDIRISELQQKKVEEIQFYLNLIEEIKDMEGKNAVINHITKALNSKLQIELQSLNKVSAEIKHELENFKKELFT